MLRPRLSSFILLLTAWLVILSAAASSLAAADGSRAEDPSGAPEWYQPASVAPVVTPAGLDDLLQPLRAEPPAPAARTDDSDLARAPHPGATVPLWKWLAAIEPERRPGASLEIEFGPDADANDVQWAADVSASWAAGDHTRAIESLRVFTESGGRCAVGVAWKPGCGPVARRDGGDVRLGGARTDCQNAVLDFDAATGRLFSIVRWGGTPTTYWTVNMSTNGGATWTETYTYGSSVGLIDVSASVVGGYVYVGYIVGNATNELRFRRMVASTGASDETYGFRTILTAGASTFTDVAAASNAEDFDNRIYLLGIQANHTLRFAWDVATDGLTFTEVASPVTNAASGLDASWANGSACAYFLHVSYTTTSDSVRIERYGTTLGWAGTSVATATGVVRPTSVSVHETTVICAYEYPYTEGRGIRYSISYDCGSSWNFGTLAIPDGAVVASYMAPDVDARDGYGTAVTYTAERGEPDPAYYQYRFGFAPGVWEDTLAFNDHDVLTGTETVIAHLPRLAAHTMSHGAIYSSGAWVPYFDYPGLGVVGAPAPAPPVGLTLRMAGANPARDGATLELAMPRAGRADVRVYDVRGALVRTLATGEFAAGRHPIAWDGACPDGDAAGSGLYFVCARGAGGEARLKLVLTK